MSVLREHATYCKSCLMERGDLTPVEVNRFIENADKEYYNKCPYCESGPVYSCSQKKIVSSGGERFFIGLVSGGLSAFMGNSNKVYWCYDCGSSGSGWF